MHQGRLSIILSILAGLLAAQGLAQEAQSAPKTSKRSVAQAKPTQAVIKGRIIAESATVYRSPDFGSQVLGRVKKGRQFSISKKPQGAFYKVLIRSGLVGYIADSEIRPLSLKNPKPEEENQEKVKAQKSFVQASFRGISLSMIRFREATMGLRPTENMLFLGFKVVSDDIVMEGSTGEVNFQISPGAPKYYEKGTGNSAAGYIILMDAMISTQSPMGKNTLSFLGFGPLFKYSKLDVTINVAGKKEAYSMNDMTLGAVFNYGLSQRIGDFALRLDAKYYWEQIQYYGFSLSGQMEF
jgi:hypothetical protein